MDAYMEVLRKYAQFSGRSSRREYWMFVLVNLAISIALSIAARVVGILGMLSLVYSLAVLVPGIAVSVRRMHDIGKSGWMLLVSLIPLFGQVLMIYWLASAGDAGDNAYGPRPEMGAAAFA